MSHARAEQVRQTLDTVEHIRAQTRADLGGLWYPTIVFGWLTVASVPPEIVWGDPASGWYWPFATVLGTALTIRFFAHREHTLGVGGRGWPFLLTAAAIALTAATLGALGTGVTGEIGPLLAVSTGQLVFAGLARSRALALLGAGTAAAALALGGLLRLPEAVWLLPLLYGVATVATGQTIRPTGGRPA